MKKIVLLILFLLPLSVHARYKRIVSLAPSLTEIVYFIGAQDQLIANTRYCDYPPEAAHKTKIGGMQDVNIEKILLLKPDLVLASYSGNSQQTAETLEKLGVKVVLFQEKKVTDILSNVTRMGQLLGKKTTRQLKSLNKKLKKIKLKDHRPRSLVLLSVQPLFSVSTHSFLGNAINTAGYANVLTMSTPYPQLSQENLLQHAPEVIILMGDMRSQLPRLEEILKRLKLSPRILFMDSDTLSRPGPRLFDAMIELNGMIE